MHPNVVKHSIPFNAEADSLNCAILAPDVTPDDEEFDLFVKEVAREMTVKAGQKCTAIRRAIVPRQHLDAVAERLKARLAKVVVGDPALEGQAEEMWIDVIAKMDAVYSDLLRYRIGLTDLCKRAFGSDALQVGHFAAHGHVVFEVLVVLVFSSQAINLVKMLLQLLIRLHQKIHQAKLPRRLSQCKLPSQQSQPN